MKKSIIALVLGAALLGCQTTPQQVESDELKLANTALINGHSDNALLIYKQRLESNPEDIELLFLAGTACNQSGRYDEALHYLNKGQALSPSPQFEREIGRAQLALGNLNEAQQALTNASDANKTDDVALNSLGVTRSLLQDYQSARESFKQALAIKPDSVEYRNNLALAWMLDGKPGQSIRILYPIYQRGEASSKVRLNLALSYAMNGDVAAAKQVAAQDLSQAELERNAQFYSNLASQVEEAVQ
ncbi:tetratricopeptide repeat protein [Vibrio brasiliensis]|uniref:tetratricopeptide repeat protein n=1 Tax=Vibrio brasiliensis TaxID=170652 RepID=UPI001EFE4883|nr:tetratricopeptide repeat protein [Vibrio brasiliensis]MCG9750319.1 tetratricopeptide repeat protein [Vibrio brasiliensis]